MSTSPRLVLIIPGTYFTGTVVVQKLFTSIYLNVTANVSDFGLSLGATVNLKPLKIATIIGEIVLFVTNTFQIHQ